MKKNTSIGTAILACLLGVWIYSERKGATAVRPPEGATNLAAFLEARPHPIQVRKFTYDGKPHVEVIGKPFNSMLSLPSGPPAYIFNESGTLVDWSRDVGDNPSFANKWRGFSNATAISLEEAKQLVKKSEP